MRLAVRSLCAVLVLAGISSPVPLPQPPALSASHAATHRREVSPGSLVSLALTGLTNLRLTERGRLRLEYQLKDSPQVFSSELIDPVNPSEGSAAWTVLPRDLPIGEVYVYLLVDGARQFTTTIDVIRSAPGVFTVNHQGFGPAAVHQYSSDGARINRLTSPAVPGQFVTLWATGLGAPGERIVVELVGRPIEPDFAGGNPVVAGLDQVNFRLPDDAPLGCYVPVAIRVGERLSNIVALSIGGNAGACPHPLPLSYDDLVSLDGGRLIDLAVFGAGGASVGLSFGRFDSNGVFALSGLQLTDEQFYSCPIQERESGGAGHTPFYPDAGPPPTFAGPGGRSIALTSSDYSRTVPLLEGPFSAPGSWLLSVFGGADIGAFQQIFWVPPPVRNVEVDPRDRDTVVSWDPSGYIPGDVIRVWTPGDNGLVCRAPAWAGRITMPAVLAGGAVNLELEPHPAARPRFQIPRRDGTAIPAFGSYGYRETVRVAEQ